MDVVSRIAELIGFDILFLGGITLVAGCMAAELWSDPRLTVAAWGSCRKRIHDLVSGPGAGVYRYVFLLLGAALIGMIINLTADRLLDQKRDPQTAEVGVGIFGREEIRLEIRR